MGVWLLYFPKIWWCHFPFLYILIPPFLNVLWQIGSSECTLVFVSTMINWCNVDTSPKEHRNLEKWHWKHLRLTAWREACWYSRYSKHEAQRQSTPCQLCPSDLQAIYEIWIIPRWGENTQGFYILCDTCDGWVRERREWLLMGLWWNEKPSQK